MPCASPSGLLTDNTREHVGKRYLSSFPFFVFFVSSDVAVDGLERKRFNLVLSWSLHAPSRRLCAATVPNQTMKALLPIFVRLAFIVFFASIVVAESLRS
mgnify:CR=1 FL=1